MSAFFKRKSVRLALAALLAYAASVATTGKFDPVAALAVVVEALQTPAFPDAPQPPAE